MLYSKLGNCITSISLLETDFFHITKILEFWFQMYLVWVFFLTIFITELFIHLNKYVSFFTFFLVSTSKWSKNIQFWEITILPNNSYFYISMYSESFTHGFKNFYFCCEQEGWPPTVRGHARSANNRFYFTNFGKENINICYCIISKVEDN